MEIRSRQSLLKRGIYLVGVMLACPYLIGGCTIEDDLSVQNDYDFAITLKDVEKTSVGSSIEVIGTVPAHKTAVFQGGAGPHGMYITWTEMEDSNGKLVGKLADFGKREQELGGCTGSRSVWYVTVGPGHKKSQ